MSLKRSEAYGLDLSAAGRMHSPGACDFIEATGSDPDGLQGSEANTRPSAGASGGAADGNVRQTPPKPPSPMLRRAPRCSRFGHSFSVPVGIAKRSFAVPAARADSRSGRGQTPVDLSATREQGEETPGRIRLGAPDLLPGLQL